MPILCLEQYVCDFVRRSEAVGWAELESDLNSLRAGMRGANSFAVSNRGVRMSAHLQK